ncbi:MAG: FAD-dependent monooxygenase [Sphingomonadales bacterium]|jgi:2-octaprenyl-6-methoxyphenol hydroxylase|nr:FAD-dependent monooxygenase [Sphingomonadales bacterium]
MDSHDVIILGGGLVGLTLAIALERHGLTAAVVDPLDPEKALAAGFDGRASAIASASWRMLDALGIAETLKPHGCAIHRIEVRDGLQKHALDFTTAEDDEPLGYMLENRTLRQALREAAVGATGVTLHMPDRAASVERNETGVHMTLASGRQIRGQLLLACEGRKSPTREAAGIRTAKWGYDHVAVISAFDHTKDHHNIAHEIFYSAGPFALLPLNPGTRSALVWTVSPKDAEGVLALSERAFLAEVTKRAGGLLGEISLAAPRSSYPLDFHHATRITAQRLALVGDAAHGSHPIAGQGLNLGFRDVAALVEVLVDGARLGLDLGDAQLLARYERWRSVDTLAVSLATDTLTRLFGIPGKPATAIRRLGLGAVQKLAPLKSIFMAEARGTSGDLPKLLQGAVV